MSDENERSVASAGSVAERPLGDPEIAVEILRLRLTDAEREAVNEAMDGYIAWMDDNCLRDTPEVQAVLYRLRGLLERLT